MKRNLNIITLVTLIIAFAYVDLSAQIVRVRFGKGRSSTSIQSTLRSWGERSYVLSARRGQNLSATVSSRGNCIVFGNITTSTNYVTDAGDNYFNVMNKCKYTVAYTLTVSIE